MSGGDIAALVAAGGFVLLVLFIAVPLIKLGKLLDEATTSVRELNDTMSPLLNELSETVTAANKQLARIDVITESAAEVATNVSSLVAVFTSAVGSPLLKLAGFTKGIRSTLKGKK